MKILRTKKNYYEIATKLLILFIFCMISYKIGFHNGVTDAVNHANIFVRPFTIGKM